MMQYEQLDPKMLLKDQVPVNLLEHSNTCRKHISTVLYIVHTVLHMYSEYIIKNYPLGCGMPGEGHLWDVATVKITIS